MSTETNNSRADGWDFRLLLASAFCMGFSLPLGRLFLVLALLAFLYGCVRGCRRFVMPLSGWLLLGLVAVGAVATANGINPAKGLHKLHKLVWYAGLPLAASLATTRERLRRLVLALLLGLAALCLFALAGDIHGAFAIVEHFSRTNVAHLFTFPSQLAMQASMVDGQRAMVAVVLALALLLVAPSLRRRPAAGFYSLSADGGGAPVHLPAVPLVPLALALAIVAEVLQLKRGSWACTIAVSALILLTVRRAGDSANPPRGRRAGRRWIAAAVAIAAIAGALALPPVRVRLAQIPDEFSAKKGGRLAMWTQVAPALFREHPMGIGFRSLTNEKMREIAPQIEKDRDHLHSNPIEMAVSFGWIGFLLYLAWMAAVFADSFLGGREAAPVGFALLALFLNGFVEYNFADSEIVLVFGLLCGLAAAAKRIRFGERCPAPQDNPTSIH